MRIYLEKTHHKTRAGGVAHSVVPEFIPQYCKKKKGYYESQDLS
jgi:hypothetical protein